MAKSNPNRQELIEFINQIDQDLPKVDKIQDLASGVHYLFLLHKVHPNVVKIGKVNLKAFHQHQNVNNLKLLALYLSEIRAPFTFEVPKTAARNYQQNLNLLKNLYKYYHSSQGKAASLSKESKEQTKPKMELRKNQPKVVIKAPQKLNKPVPVKKYSPDNSGLKGITLDSKNCLEKIKKILIVVQQNKTPQQEAAQEKLQKIKKILGIEAPYSQMKNKKTNQSVNYSNKCSASKTNMKKQEQFDQQKTDLKTKTQDKAKSKGKNQATNGQNKTDANKNIKAFDCEEIKQSVINKYNGRSTRKSINTRRLTSHQKKQMFGTEDEDQRYNESLLSPPASGNNNPSRRKSISRKSQNQNQISQQKIPVVSTKKQIQKSSKKINIETMLSVSQIKQPKNQDKTEKENQKVQNQ